METPAGEDSKQRFKEMRAGNGEGCIEGDSLSGTTDVWRVGLEGQNEVSDQEISAETEDGAGGFGVLAYRIAGCRTVAVQTGNGGRRDYGCGEGRYRPDRLGNRGLL